ncbi:MAG: alpha/beta fold hydrolase [Candidatus Melainabacteria bacterium]|nr:alpha/beta fold hydrolase [Candidatus Melainabacteria bacterium]
MHSVDSSQKPVPKEESITASPPFPLQSLASGEKLKRDHDGEVEVVTVGASQIHMRKFPAPGQGPVALYLHGIEGHSLWFANTAHLMASAGITVYAPDRRGAGLNFVERGHVESAAELIRDVEFFLKLVAERHPGQPVFLIGNCWGAKAAAIIVSDRHKWTTAGRAPSLSGLILICPAIKTKPDLNVVDKLSIALALLSGKAALRAHLPIPLTCSMFTDNPVFLSYIDNDPLRLTSASKAFYFASFVLTLRSQSAASSIKIPTLILQSGNDAIVNVDGIESWFLQIDHKDKQLKKYSGAFHSMDFDNRHFVEYARDLSDWIALHADKRGSQ